MSDAATTTHDRSIHMIVFSHLDLTFMGSHECSGPPCGEGSSPCSPTARSA